MTIRQHPTSGGTASPSDGPPLSGTETGGAAANGAASAGTALSDTVPGAAGDGTAGNGAAGNGARPPRLVGEGLTLAYDKRTIAEGLDVAVPDRSFTVIVGPNACGKSTLLRALARILKPAAGTVVLDGERIGAWPAKKLARTLGLLPQSSIAPEGITVADLVARGRYPHQGLLRQWSREDERVVAESMAATGVADLAERAVDELSGGQRQRVWIAMALAQQTPLLLLDEPTTYLDIAHQIEVLDLCADLHESGRTVVAVLHDLNHAARYATHLIALRDGRIAAEGAPGEVVTAELVREVFRLPCRVIEDPETGTPLVVPAARR
ncbi:MULTISPECIES: ABC transporter ATP-binding protein [Actinomadura]|uniref:ABC transporter ATP-binding protein n=1 Tax=Actinomadura yumaensis TaxID=111807 RepID=A0ABW2CHM0_9ACTN|nr:ABC transporter ATP-binding protein [Actinomadura sp. J1-007]